MSESSATESRRGLTAGLARWLVHPWLPLHLALVAVALCLPALGVGWQFDDNFHRIALTGSRFSDANPLEIFSILRHGPEVRQIYLDFGAFPWWTSQEFKIAFVRHLSAVTAWLDFRLWPESAPLQHAHSLVWFGALVAAVASLYRRLHGRIATAGLAALLFAVDDAHGTAAGWLANRNALVASLFGVLCLIAHDRWRREGHRGAAILAPVFLALALAGGELALGAAAYLAAYALFLDPAPPRARLASLAPAGGVLVAWAALYRSLGFGAAGSGLYVDPAGEPVAFAAGLLYRAPFYLAGQLSPMPADLGSLLPAQHQTTAWWIAAGIALLLATALAPLVASDRRARFWALGSLLSIVPLCATFPANRVLFFSGLGGMALIAQWLGRWWKTSRSGVRRWAAGSVAVLFIATHLILAPALLPATAGAMKTFGEPVGRSVLTLPDDPALADQDLVVINAPDYLLYVSQIMPLLVLEDRPYPRRVRGLAIGPSAVEVTRIDEHTLDLTMETGYLGGPLGSLYRAPSDRLETGATITLSNLTATILATTPDGRPETVRFRFKRQLDSPGLRWVAFKSGSFELFPLPPTGQTVTLPAAKGPFDLLIN